MKCGKALKLADDRRELADSVRKSMCFLQTCSGFGGSLAGDKGGRADTSWQNPFNTSLST